MSRRVAIVLLAFALEFPGLSRGAGAPALPVPQKKPVTIEALANPPKSAPQPGAPIWAPDGKRFLYTESGKLWLFDLSTRAKKELLAMQALEAAAVKPPAPERFDFTNRRVQEPEFQWGCSGRTVLISSEGDIFLLHLDTGKWDQLTATPVREADPKLSPDERNVAFRQNHDLYVLNVATKKVTRLTHDGTPTLLNGELDWVYPEELDLGTAYWWSPDSTRIAYLQFDTSREPVYPQADLLGRAAVYEPERYPQAGDPNADVRLGVAPAEGGRTTWLDIGQTRDMLTARVDWTPDSTALAVVRLNRIQNRLDLLLADAKTGDSRCLFRETDPYWINLHGGPVFIRWGREFLWQSERDGFNHLYKYSIEGRELAQLTRGAWEVTSIDGVDETAGQVYFTSSEASPLERQLYRVGFDGGPRTRLTQGAGTHSISMAPGCEYWLDSFSSLTTPPRRTLYRRDGSELMAWSAADPKPLEEYVMLPAEIVQFKGSDGSLFYGKLIKPAGYQPGKRYPVIVNVYGGPAAQQVRNAWSGPLSMDQVLAQHGYLVWTMDNHGSAGRGHQWEIPVFHNLGEREVKDQVEGVKYLIAQGLADPERVGIQGWSYGGYLTLHSLLMAPDVFRCGIAGAPVTDWRNYDTIYTERYLGLPEENEEGYRESSPVHAAANLKGRLLLIHNIEDDNVLFANALQMMNALQMAGKSFQTLIYPQKSHGLSGRASQHRWREQTRFFEEALR